MLLDVWSPAGRAVVLTVLVDLELLAVLRTAGSRAISRMSAHGLIVTVALGSLVATMPLRARAASSIPGAAGPAT